MKREKESHADNAADTTYKARNLGMTNKRPGVPADLMEYDQDMLNTGDHAQELARKLTKGIGPEFPVK